MEINVTRCLFSKNSKIFSKENDTISKLPKANLKISNNIFDGATFSSSSVDASLSQIIIENNTFQNSNSFFSQSIFDGITFRKNLIQNRLSLFEQGYSVFNSFFEENRLLNFSSLFTNSKPYQVEIKNVKIIKTSLGSDCFLIFSNSNMKISDITLEGNFKTTETDTKDIRSKILLAFQDSTEISNLKAENCHPLFFLNNNPGFTITNAIIIDLKPIVKYEFFLFASKSVATLKNVSVSFTGTILQHFSGTLISF